MAFRFLSLFPESIGGFGRRNPDAESRNFVLNITPSGVRRKGQSAFDGKIDRYFAVTAIFPPVSGADSLKIADAMLYLENKKKRNNHPFVQPKLKKVKK